MNSIRTKNAVGNIIWGFMEKAVAFACPFIVRTFLIYRLGAEFSGLGSLFTSILSALNLAELGLANAIIFHMYKPLSVGDNGKVCALLNYFKKAYYAIGIIVFSFGIIIMPFIPRLIKDDIPVGVNIFIIYFVYLLNSVIGYFMFSYETSFLSASQKEDILSKNLLVYNLLLCLLQCTFIVLSKNYYLFVTAVPACTVILNLLNHWTIKRKYPYINAVGDISNEEKKSLRKELYGLAIWKIGGASRNSFDSMFISAFVGLVAITAYDNYFQIISSVMVITGVLCTSINAGVGDKIASKSVEENYNDFIRLHFLYMWVSGWCITCIFCMIQPFMRIWMGENLMLPFGMVVLLCYYFFMMKKGDINSVYYHASGLWWEGRYRSIFEALLNISLNYILGRKYGLFGIIIATIISFSLVNIYGASLVFTKYFKNNKYFAYVLENLFFLVVISTGCIASYLIGQYIIERLNILNEYCMLVVCFGVCVFVPNAIMIFAYGCFSRYRKDMLYILNIVKGLAR